MHIKLKHIFSALTISLMMSVGTASASDGVEGRRNEVRIGIGDMLFESLVWNSQVHKDYSGMPDGKLFQENVSYSYSPHISGEYSYHVLPWLSVGAIVDFQYTGWRKNIYDNRNSMKESSMENFFNLCFMPCARFNYFRREHVGLYSSIAMGIDINGGTETNGYGKRTEVGFAADIRFIGVRAGGGNWWGFLDFGGIYALRHKNFLYMINSEIFKIGVSYSF